MAYTLAQNPTGANGTGTSISKAFASTVTAHSLLVAFLCTDSSAASLAFTGGGTWVTGTGSKQEPLSTQFVRLGYCLDATGGTAPTVQATWTGSGSFNGLVIAEFANAGVASLVDVQTAGTTASSANPTDTAMSATGADCVVSWVVSNGQAVTVGATFTFGTNQDNTDFAFWEYKVLGGSGSVTPVFTMSSNGWAIISACFKPSGAAAAAPPNITTAPMTGF